MFWRPHGCLFEKIEFEIAVFALKKHNAGIHLNGRELRTKTQDKTKVS